MLEQGSSSDRPANGGNGGGAAAGSNARTAKATARSPAAGPWANAGAARALRRLRRRRHSRLLIPLAVLCTFTVLLVGWEVVESRFAVSTSVGSRHAMLTVRAGVVAAVAATIVYLLMRGPQRRLSNTAERLGRLLESYNSKSPGPLRFENPHLVHCRELVDCGQRECPLYDAQGERCWQLAALSRAAHGCGDPPANIEQCHKCPVYQACCPDKLTALGESFNNLMFLLEREAASVERMRTQMAEREKMAAIGQIAAGVAHEVSNPLSSIFSVVQMLRRGGAGPDPKASMELIETHIKRIWATIRQLSNMARPVSDRRAYVDVAESLGEAVRLIEFDQRARNVEMRFERPPTELRTYAAGGQLQQVFVNLLLNALDAMPDGGELTVRAQSAAEEIVIEVEDTGEGIAPGTGRRVFEPFFTTKEPGHGVGLGLAVSYNIVDKHGGTIDYDPAATGGTVFTVRIPIQHQPPGEP